MLHMTEDYYIAHLVSRGQLCVISVIGTESEFQSEPIDFNLYNSWKKIQVSFLLKMLADVFRRLQETEGALAEMSLLQRKEKALLPNQRQRAFQCISLKTFTIMGCLCFQVSIGSSDWEVEHSHASQVCTHFPFMASSDYLPRRHDLKEMSVRSPGKFFISCYFTANEGNQKKQLNVQFRQWRCLMNVAHTRNLLLTHYMTEHREQ